MPRHSSLAALRLHAVALTLALAGSLAACASVTPAQIREARSSTYSCPLPEVVAAASEAMEEVFPPLGEVDAERGTVTSEFRWFDEDGTRRQKGMSQVQDKGVSISGIVEIRPARGALAVLTGAIVLQIRAGLSAPVPLPADSPDRPKWVAGKLDKLAVEIHTRLERCASTAPPPAP